MTEREANVEKKHRIDGTCSEHRGGDVRLHFLQVIGPANVYKCVTQRPPTATTMQAIKHEIFRLEMQLHYLKYTFPCDEGYVPSKPLLERLLAKQQELFAAQQEVVDASHERTRALLRSKQPHMFERQTMTEMDAIIRKDQAVSLSLVYMQKNIDDTKRQLDACRHMTRKEWRAVCDKRRRDRRTKKTLLGARLKLEEWLAGIESKPTGVMQCIIDIELWLVDRGDE